MDEKPWRGEKATTGDFGPVDRDDRALEQTLEVEDVAFKISRHAPRPSPFVEKEDNFSWTKQWYPVAVADMIDL